MRSSIEEVAVRIAALVGDRAHIVGPETPVAAVAEVMFSEAISAVAVVDRTGIVGICTDRDLARALAAGRDGTDPVVDVMTAAPDMVSPDVTVADAATWLLETGYRHLPVVEDGELLGIVDVRDVLWALVPKSDDGDS